MKKIVILFLFVYSISFGISIYSNSLLQYKIDNFDIIDIYNIQKNKKIIKQIKFKMFHKNKFLDIKEVKKIENKDNIELLFLFENNYKLDVKIYLYLNRKIIKLITNTYNKDIKLITFIKPEKESKLRKEEKYYKYNDFYFFSNNLNAYFSTIENFLNKKLKNGEEKIKDIEESIVIINNNGIDEINIFIEKSDFKKIKMKEYFKYEGKEDVIIKKILMNKNLDGSINFFYNKNFSINRENMFFSALYLLKNGYLDDVKEILNFELNNDLGENLCYSNMLFLYVFLEYIKITNDTEFLSENQENIKIKYLSKILEKINKNGLIFDNGRDIKKPKGYYIENILITYTILKKIKGYYINDKISLEIEEKIKLLKNIFDKEYKQNLNKYNKKDLLFINENNLLGEKYNINFMQELKEILGENYADVK
ncbi:hypothetical protein EV215_1458 [Hypnocyclicus thermotrophus]|uniref:Uncharacterized protein n=1 Tax=Hypnocyclicus thermotrophus TaxID=1627895 RepID=A0AA46DXU6_9FUSO|nr:hypothetical protein [Hypnocyclicus thermotrophus]TDT69116.1 hypothetical protein EV215_1458 [Hypnocyclicus thermotrophus]